jgi:adenylate kinase
VKLLFIGPPGAGKGTQAGLVAKRLGIPHVSTGEMFRHHVSSGTELGKKVKAILEGGGYVPDDITVAMLEERLAEPDARDGYILDGFPRTGPQVEALDDLIGKDGLDRVVLFDVDEDVLAERLLARGRADDTEDTIRNRFKIYQEQTSPLIEIYDGRGLVARIDGLGEMDEVTDRVLEAVADAGTPLGRSASGRSPRMQGDNAPRTTHSGPEGRP